MKYIEMGNNSEGIMIYGRQDDNGLIRITCTAENPDYQAYLASLEAPAE
jgi:hypothetical protein